MKKVAEDSTENKCPELTIDNFMNELKRRNPGETEFHQSVEEVMSYLIPYVQLHPKYRKAQILERLTEPDRIVVFRVCWQDDQGSHRTNRGFRVQFNDGDAVAGIQRWQSPEKHNALGLFHIAWFGLGR